MNKNKIVALFLLTGLLASCTKSNIDNANTSTWISMENNTQKQELLTSWENKPVEKKLIDNKNTQIIDSKNQLRKHKNTNTIVAKNTVVNTQVALNTNGNTVKNEIKFSNPIDVVKKLRVSSKCIWCGRCASVDPSNFAMSIATYKSTIISQKNIDSSSVSNAINWCPAWAISIS